MSAPRQTDISPWLIFGSLFVLSGAAAVTYEVVWTRMLVQVFGVTGFAVSTVLVSFMGGLALGAAVLGRRADRVARPLRLFALCEMGIAIFALAFPWILVVADRVFLLVGGILPDSFIARSVVRFVLCVAVLLVPTSLMGATLPALGRGLLRGGSRLASGIGWLYFANTVGAAVGCYLAGFALIPGVGLLRTTLVAAALNAIVAVTAWVLDREAVRKGVEPAPAIVSPDEEPPACSPPWWPLAVAFGSGFVALAFEVVWFRVLVLVFGSTVYSFSAMLSVFLFGLAVGSAWAARVADRWRSPVAALAAIQGAVALFTLLGSLSVNRLPRLFLSLLPQFGLDFEGMNTTKLLLSFVALFPAALAFGATFPFVIRLASPSGAGTGTRIARVYAWNTVGAIAGSFLAGFVLVPAIGAEWTLQLAIVVATAVAIGTFVADRAPLRWRWAIPAGAAAVAIAAVALVGPRWDRRLLGVGAYFEPRQFYDADGRVALERVVSDYRLMTYTEGFNDTIISFLSPKGKFITVNGSPTASDQLDDMLVQRSLGHVPVALHPGPVRRACVVGLGVGVTAGAIAQYADVDNVTVVELERGVFEACRAFDKENHGVLSDPKVHVVIDDARSYLKTTRDRFDVISSEPNFPSLGGAGALYNVDFLRTCRARLAPGGTMCHWSPLWRLDPEEVRRIVASFREVFPHVRVFANGLCLVLLGRDEPFPAVDFAELERRLAEPKVRASLAEIGIRGPVELLSLYQLGDAEVARYVAGVAPSTDDRPMIEYRSPRYLFANSVGPNLACVAAVRPTVEERAAQLGVPEGMASSFVALASAGDAAAEGQVLLARGETERGLGVLVPAAQAGHRYARNVVANHAIEEGRMAQRGGAVERARAWFSIAVEFEPERPEALVGLGFADVLMGRLDEGEKFLGEAVRLFPRSGGAAYRLGIAREMQGRAAEAEALYRKAIELEPLLPEPYGLLGGVLMAQGNAADALSDFEASLRLGGVSEGVVLGRAQALMQLGRGREALAAARAAVGAFPGSADAYEVLARAAAAQGAAAEAEAARQRREELLRQRTPPAPPAAPSPASPGP